MLDGRKMSKSYGNVIDVFLPKKQLKKHAKLKKAQDAIVQRGHASN
jgi:tryptophanyl-tRNA synthetase